MPRLLHSSYAVPSMQRTCAFYVEKLSMQLLEGDSSSTALGSSCVVGYPGDNMTVELVEAGKAAPAADAPGYWKIGVGLQDVNGFAKEAQTKGLRVSAGSQFMDVGFLTHLQDADGECIEFLQDTFESNFRKKYGSTSPKNEPHIGQVSLRSTNIDAATQVFRDWLGMRLVCCYKVDVASPFFLYFFAYTEEKAPSDDPWHVDNREWTYSLPVTTVEVHSRTLQSKDSKNAPAPMPRQHATKDQLGWQGITIEVKDIDETMAAKPSFVSRSSAAPLPCRSTGKAVEVTDGDGFRIRLFQRGA